MRKLIATLALPLVMLGGCTLPSGEPEEVKTVTLTPEEAFLEELDSVPGLSTVDDQTLITGGRTTCDVFDGGYGYEDALSVMLNSGMDARDGVPLIEASAEYLCPEHRGKVK